MKIKQIPEDFIVDEVIKLNITKDKNNYSIIKVTKKNWESFKIIEALSKSLKTKTKFIGFAGNKDKYALTTQYISLYKVPKERIEKIRINNVKIFFLGYSINRINLGDLEGNNFKIIIRDLAKKVKLPRNIQLENYFDEQRFGNKANTHLIGKAIIKRDFKEACNLLNLEINSNDYVGALRKQQRRLLRFYISSFQSYLWNKTLSRILSKNKNYVKVKYSLGEFVFIINKMKNFKLPIINFDLENNKEIEETLKEEKIKKEDFILKEIPELISTTQFRDAFIDIKNINYSWNKDELNNGKIKLELSFFLTKGSYATMLIKKLSIFLNN